MDSATPLKVDLLKEEWRKKHEGNQIAGLLLFCSLVCFAGGVLIGGWTTDLFHAEQTFNVLTLVKAARAQVLLARKRCAIPWPEADIDRAPRHADPRRLM